MGNEVVDVDALMDDIFTAFGADEDLKPGEFTIMMYAKKNGIAYQKASDQLLEAVGAGMLVEVNRSVVVDGKRVLHVYRKA